MFCNRSIFCFLPLAHEGDCILRSSADGPESLDIVGDGSGNALPPVTNDEERVLLPAWRKRLTARDETSRIQTND